jgi:hypothetical protein
MLDFVMAAMVVSFLTLCIVGLIKDILDLW